MQKKIFLLGSTLLGASLLLSSITTTLNGCTNSESETANSGDARDGGGERRLSRKGEACEVTNDCAPPYACQSTGFASGVCVVAEFKISPTAKECAMLECIEANDCCPPPAPQCPELLKRCNASDGGLTGNGSPQSFECMQYTLSCKCDSTTVTCDQGKCTKGCTQDAECLSIPTGATKCSEGKCVRCSADADCGSGHSCIGNQCVAACQSDGECPGFSRCDQGKCIASGCKSNRECISATHNVEATCGTADGKCTIPCQSDLECDNPKGHQFFSCINNQCTYTGCDTDKDCLLAAYNGSDAAIPARQRFVCRDKAK